MTASSSTVQEFLIPAGFETAGNYLGNHGRQKQFEAGLDNNGNGHRCRKLPARSQIIPFRSVSNLTNSTIRA
jgi:hypothetical protein